MPPKTKAAALVIETKHLKIKDLNVYHKNPRVGNVEAIAESLDKNAQYKPIVVNIGTHTGRKNEILCGNHTYLAARRLGWSDIYATLVDVDEVLGTKIVLADNKTADLGEYEDTLLAELFRGLPDESGTGYTKDEFTAVLTQIEEQTAAAVGALEDTEQFIADQRRDEAEAALKGTFDGAPLGEEPDPEEDEEDVLYGAKDTHANGMMSYKSAEEVEFDGVGSWEIPRLIPEMLMTADELPPNLETWAGSATKDWADPTQWWLYNWGIDSTSGMNDVSKVIVSFYAHDEYFENWYWYPDRYAAKLVNSGIKYAVTPNFTPSDVSRTLSLLQLYKSRFVGRYLQEVGIKVIPNLEWNVGSKEDRDFLMRVIVGTLPVGIPLISVQLQVWHPEEVPGGEAEIRDTYQAMLDKLQPQAVLLYAGDPGLEFFKTLNYTGEVIHLYPRMRRLAEAAKNRQKKATI